MDSEKKFKLDELPDEGSKPQSKPRPKPAAPRPNPLKGLDAGSKSRLMEQKWVFDRVEWLYGWVGYVSVVLALQFLNLRRLMEEEYADRSARVQKDDLFGQMLDVRFEGLEFLAGNVWVLVLLTPAFFRFTRTSESYFQANYEGLSTLKSIALKPREMPIRVFIKWPEIIKVERGTSNRRPVLVLHSPEGRAGELIWDLPMQKKKALRLLLNGLLPDTHPLRAFIEKDLV
jgi:hypothetical protein